MSRLLVVDRMFWRDKRLAKRSPRARIVWLAVLSVADDRGRITSDAQQLVRIAFPYATDGEILASVERDLIAFVHGGLLRRGTRAGGQPCLRIVDWQRRFSLAREASASGIRRGVA